MVTIKVENLINFVAEVFSHSESSPKKPGASPPI